MYRYFKIMGGESHNQVEITLMLRTQFLERDYFHSLHQDSIDL